jgi:hypothetical protein
MNLLPAQKPQFAEHEAKERSELFHLMRRGVRPGSSYASTKDELQRKEIILNTLKLSRTVYAFSIGAISIFVAYKIKRRSTISRSTYSEGKELPGVLPIAISRWEGEGGHLSDSSNQ